MTIFIVIPCLNGSKFINDLLNCIDRQTFKPYTHCNKN